MDNATIIELFKRQDENIDKMGKEIKEYVGVSMSLNRAKFINELDPIKNQLDEIVDQNCIRNHRIEKIEANTAIARFIEKNKIVSAILLLAFVMGGAFLYHHMNFKKTFENHTKIELKDDQ